MLLASCSFLAAVLLLQAYLLQGHWMSSRFANGALGSSSLLCGALCMLCHAGLRAACRGMPFYFTLLACVGHYCVWIIITRCTLDRQWKLLEHWRWNAMCSLCAMHRTEYCRSVTGPSNSSWRASCRVDMQSLGHRHTPLLTCSGRCWLGGGDCLVVLQAVVRLQECCGVVYTSDATRGPRQ